MRHMEHIILHTSMHNVHLRTIVRQLGWSQLVQTSVLATCFRDKALFEICGQTFLQNLGVLIFVFVQYNLALGARDNF